jgi:hypothetical protein
MICWTRERLDKEKVSKWGKGRKKRDKRRKGGREVEIEKKCQWNGIKMRNQRNEKEACKPHRIRVCWM